MESAGPYKRVVEEKGCGVEATIAKCLKPELHWSPVRRLWTTERSVEDRALKKLERETAIFQGLSDVERPVLVVQERRDFVAKGITEPQDPTRFLKLTRPARVVDDLEEAERVAEALARRGVSPPPAVSEETPVLVSKIRGVELLPRGFSELDPLMYKDDYYFKNAGDEKEFEREQRALKAIRRKQWGQRSLPRAREVEVVAVELFSSKIRQIFTEFFEINQRPCSSDELEMAARALGVSFDLVEKYHGQLAKATFRFQPQTTESSQAKKKGPPELPISLRPLLPHLKEYPLEAKQAMPSFNKKTDKLKQSVLNASQINYSLTSWGAIEADQESKISKYSKEIARMSHDKDPLKKLSIALLGHSSSPQVPIQTSSILAKDNSGDFRGVQPSFLLSVPPETGPIMIENQYFNQKIQEKKGTFSLITSNLNGMILSEVPLGSEEYKGEITASVIDISQSNTHRKYTLDTIDQFGSLVVRQVLSFPLQSIIPLKEEQLTETDTSNQKTNSLEVSEESHPEPKRKSTKNTKSSAVERKISYSGIDPEIYLSKSKLSKPNLHKSREKIIEKVPEKENDKDRPIYVSEVDVGFVRSDEHKIDKHFSVSKLKPKKKETISEIYGKRYTENSNSHLCDRLLEKSSFENQKSISTSQPPKGNILENPVIPSSSSSYTQSDVDAINKSKISSSIVIPRFNSGNLVSSSTGLSTSQPKISKNHSIAGITTNPNQPGDSSLAQSKIQKNLSLAELLKSNHSEKQNLEPLNLTSSQPPDNLGDSHFLKEKLDKYILELNESHRFEHPSPSVLKDQAKTVFLQEAKKIGLNSDGLFEEFYHFCEQKLGNDAKFQKSIVLISLFYFFLERKP